MSGKLVPLFEKPHDRPTAYDGLLGWSAEWKCYLDPEGKPVPLDDIISLDATETEVVVRKGDTLSKIANQHHCAVDDIVKLNGIANPALIYPGQRLRIPAPYYTYDEPVQEPDTSPEPCLLSFTFFDLIEKPLAGLKVKIVSALGDVYESVTDDMGKIKDYLLKAESQIQVFVSSAAGKVKEVASFTPMPGKMDIILTSPKVRVKGKSVALEGTPGYLDRNKHEVYTISEGRNSQGKPVVQVNHVCPNNYDLSLGKNFIYWNEIIAASERSGFIPQSIAAVINAEAAKHKGGIWNPDSVCLSSERIKAEKARRRELGLPTDDVAFYKSSAAGMTQFLNGTWMDETLREGTFLYEKAKASGLVAFMPKQDSSGEVVTELSGRPVLETKFQVSLDLWKSSKELKREGYLDGGTPYPPKATYALKTWLDKRFVAEYAIMAAVDYGVHNLEALEKAGYRIAALDDAEKAKLIYLTHHLGLTDTIRFIKGTITEEAAKRLLIAQVGAGKAKEYAEINNRSYSAGHREWLLSFIDDYIKVHNFICPEKIKELNIKEVETIKIIKKVVN
ncbi:peptidoglycan-binding LysM [Chimaeribacter coloradensis]|uniref:Peptidoglycan-binding LysM n=1 Tax=Chimaeribacter coloradensis TaxID=2060068 RepID=A0A2N5DSP1_9GAMM|nr:LysM domain-containing protein [Chimaeribacter coloradensis]PLR29182.1 peptidoglycan-binding LysM [Chimaeribacter coloradensis]